MGIANAFIKGFLSRYRRATRFSTGKANDFIAGFQTFQTFLFLGQNGFFHLLIFKISLHFFLATSNFVNHAILVELDSLRLVPVNRHQPVIRVIKGRDDFDGFLVIRRQKRIAIFQDLPVRVFLTVNDHQELLCLGFHRLWLHLKFSLDLRYRINFHDRRLRRFSWIS